MMKSKVSEQGTPWIRGPLVKGFCEDGDELRAGGVGKSSCTWYPPSAGVAERVGSCCRPWGVREIVLKFGPMTLAEG
jgi:hypothetical protein